MRLAFVTLHVSVTQPKPTAPHNTANFNSHAHVERDVWYISCGVHKKHFNSHAHVERDSIGLLTES